MEVELLINRANGETRVALLEDGSVKELYIERDRDRGIVGNVYRGRVTRVLPGMQAAFVEVGLERAAFLYVADIVLPEELQQLQEAPEHAEPPEPVVVDETESQESQEPQESQDSEPPAPRAPRPSIAALLRPGQQITVQIAKEPLGTKGARVTNYVTLPGRYVVFMPTMDRIGVSRKITDEAERKRLKSLLESLRKPGEGGFIARTVCTGLEEKAIDKDMNFVRSLWSQVVARAEEQRAPAMLQQDLDLVLRATRDLFTENVTRLVVDNAHEADRIKNLVGKFAPELAERVELSQDTLPLFDRYGIEGEVERALLRKITLKSGVTIVVDEAEALTAIDVNTGRFVGNQDLEATILRTNLEAAKAIAAQIRLRNLGGIIIVDFIDMQSEDSRKQVYDAFCEEIALDRAKTHVLSMSGLGLIEMTRKRVRASLGRSLTEACPYCDGRGRVRSKTTISHDIFREIDRQARLHPDGAILVSAMPEVAGMLADDREHLPQLERKLGRSIVVEARGDFHQEVYQVSVRPGAR